MRSPYILTAFVYGLNRPYNVALLVPDVSALTAHFNCKPEELHTTRAAEVHALLLAETQQHQMDRETVPAYARVGLIDFYFP